MLPPLSEERSLVIYWCWRRFINPHECQAQLQLLLNLLILIFLVLEMQKRWPPRQL